MRVAAAAVQKGSLVAGSLDAEDNEHNSYVDTLADAR